MIAQYQRAVLVSHISRYNSEPSQLFCSSLDKPRISLGEGCPEEIHPLPSGPRLSCWPQQSQRQRGEADAHSWWTLLSLWGVHAIHCCPSWLLLNLFSKQLCVCCRERRDSIQIKISLSLQGTTNHPHLLASVCDARTSRLCVLLFFRLSSWNAIVLP